ncbi:nitroreductase [Sphingorhabdus sp. IMCC26285]|uniref:Putative NAD(P)H nitroreductase n=1 Tax=Sphingorhabdus profundilacus TaxID=2509718 RepID=A0A6I4LYF5_9SPHN|nr:nitroreductase [Sphingorhabdus profundilacus]MVZ96884.1 nitroreductase [Sphingorhabdus profundilacus]
MFNDLSSVQAYLATRRSGKPRDMVAPGPDASTLAEIVALATRTPDHGKLFPWRLTHIADRKAFATLLENAFLAANPDARTAQIEAAIAPAFMAPTLIALIYAPQPSAKIPLWEQQMSVGAVGMNLLHAAHAHGFVGSWITGWACYDPMVSLAFCPGDEQLAGFFYIGSAGQQLEERPRPELSLILRQWP